MSSLLRNQPAELAPVILLEIIKAQTEIVRLGPDLGGVITCVATQVQHLTKASGAIVELAEGDDMVYRAASGMAGAQLGLRLQRKGSLSGLCVASNRILRCDDSETDPRVDREACRKVGLRSMVVAPLRHNDVVVGVLKIASVDPNGFSESDVRVLELMSDMVGSAMYQAVRYETDELYHRATHDPLTGLANRALFCDRLRQCVVAPERRSSQTGPGVIILDMDGLKLINDTHGHRAGDAAICEAADRISRVVRPTDTVARLGGDEFGIVMPGASDRQNMSCTAERIIGEVSLPFCFEAAALRLSVSAGTAIFPEDGTEIDVLIEAADQAMYKVKKGRVKTRHY
ncbi:diguanylate cyclase [Azospirillum sp. TSA6c]|uniref:sensor domain-containing diguanylate cyclase n=1 Tax=Azospirillum sp. TSA6c TaxID=709813 RepID=UPI000D609EB2|nr:sensor domain-containing diguanylate cyclase [Azospirillum sp. TSA6c]PWC48140.1 diguanylate cyclase [Azospirillum sp. TSA6c]